MKTKLFSILNLISVIFLIAWNGYANTGNYNGKSVGDLSAEYNNLFTPASYAFSIWGIIFIMLLVFGAYGVYSSFIKTSPADSSYQDAVEKTAPWFLIANIFCAAWVVFWLDEMVGISVLCMLGILISLLICVVKLEIEQRESTNRERFFSWLPISLYTGWISVATVANFSALLNSSFDITLEVQEIVMIVILLVTSVIYIMMLLLKKMRVFTMVGVWALIAIAARHWISENAMIEYHHLGIMAATLAVILLIAVIFKSIQLTKAS